MVPVAAAAVALPNGVATVLANQPVNATPRPSGSVPDDLPLDPRARELSARLSGLSPLAVLEALETSEVTEPSLASRGSADAPLAARAWIDPTDTDLQHALGGVLIAAGDQSVHSADLDILGGYIVFESPEIAFTIFREQLGKLGDQGSTSVAGGKVWLVEADDDQLGVMRIANIMIIAVTAVGYATIAEGLVNHLVAVTKALG